MRKVLVTGYKGQLGYDVVKELEKRGVEALGVDIDDFDLTNERQTIDFIEKYCPTEIVHCAAYTAVDKAEDDYDTAYAVNALGTKNMAMGAYSVGAKMIYISTDYVFNGQKESPYSAYDEKDPIGAYGKTKYLGEKEAKLYLDKLFIVRLSWVFGLNGNNFVKTMLRLGKERDSLGVVADQIGSPTYTPHASKILCDMLETEKYGEYNLSNEGYCSWYDFANKIFEIAKIDIPVKPLKTEEYPTKAQRPKNSCFTRQELLENGFEKMPAWQDALKDYIEKLSE